MDEDGTLQRDKVRIRKRWGGFFQTLLNKKSPKLDLHRANPTTAFGTIAWSSTNHG